MLGESTSGSGRAISLDRKFNTAVTEASIKIDENVSADGGRDRIRRVVLHSAAESAASSPEGVPFETIREKSKQCETLVIPWQRGYICITLACRNLKMYQGDLYYVYFTTKLTFQ